MQVIDSLLGLARIEDGGNNASEKSLHICCTLASPLVCDIKSKMTYCISSRFSTTRVCAKGKSRNPAASLHHIKGGAVGSI